MVHISVATETDTSFTSQWLQRQTHRSHLSGYRDRHIVHISVATETDTSFTSQWLTETDTSFTSQWLTETDTSFTSQWLLRQTHRSHLSGY